MDSSTVYLLAIAVILLIALGLVGVALLSHIPRQLAPVGDALAECGSRPNCVSSLADDPRFQVESLPLTDSVEATMAQLKSVVGSLPRTRMVTVTDTYLHAVCESRWLRFVDDVEFLIRADAGRIDVRSASRVGYSDLGQNRGRVNSIRYRLGGR